MMFEDFLNELWAEVMNWIAWALIALLLAVSLVAFITHLVGWVFLLVDNLIVGVEISASIGGVVFFLVLLLFWFSFLFLLILLGLGL